MASVVLVLFWFSVASGFLFMSLLTLWLRQRIVPRQIAEAKKEEYFAGADVAKLKIIFDHTQKKTNACEIADYDSTHTSVAFHLPDDERTFR